MSPLDPNSEPPASAFGELAAVAKILGADASGRNGDDCAVLPPGEGHVVVTTDTAVDGVHLHTSLTPFEQGYRAAACALSDLAGMGATPAGVVAALVIPPNAWPEAPIIAAGVRARAHEVGCDLVGGDLVGGEQLSITVTCIGRTHDPAVRSGGSPGDVLVVSGMLGRSAAGLAALENDAADEELRGAYVSPPDRTELGRLAAGFATAMMDISDGLALDALRLASASACGVIIDLDALPLTTLSVSPGTDPALTAATHGDDYELLIAVAPVDLEDLFAAADGLPVPVALTVVGELVEPDRTAFLRHGAPIAGLHGFSH